MGCETSSGIQPSKAKYSPIVRNIPTDKKQKIAELIQEDDLAGLALQMQQIGANPNSEISDQGMLWMLHHLCCRWDADNCLQFLLKQYFAQNPKSYIDYVNALTYQGYGPLHLCGLWQAQKCFHVLNYYGGINVAAKDKMYRTGLQIAKENKCKSIVKVLEQYKNMNVTFTTIQIQRLLSGDIISQEPKKSDRKSTAPTQLDPNLKNMTGLLFNDIKAEEEQKKKQLEAQRQRLAQQKLQKQQEAAQEQRKAQQKIDNENQQIQKLKQIQQKREKQKKLYEQKLRIQQEQLKKMKQQKQKNQEAQVMKRRSEQIKKVQQISETDKEKIMQRMKLKVNTLNALKKKKQENPTATKAPKSELQNSVHKPSQPKKGIPEQVMNLYEQTKASGSKFIDKEFPATQKSLGDRKKAQSKGLLKNLGWLRPNQIFKGDFQLFDGIDPNDIKQGSLGVCYMLAAISALAKNPKNIQRLFEFYDIDLGFYVLNLYINGKPKYLVIDDLIPCNKTVKSPLFTKPIGNQIWVLLIEKAWAKAVGNYLSAQAMTPDHIMQDFSGAPGYGQWFNKNNETRSPMRKLKQVIQHLKKQYIVVLTSGDTKMEGIVANHAYSVLGCYQVHGRILFKIRNPWGRFQWKGQYCDDSSLWTEQTKKQVGNDGKDDGIFFLTQNQLLQAFGYFSISKIKNNYTYSYTQFSTEKDQSIFYKFNINKKGHINLRVTQPFQRMVQDSSYKHSPMILETGKILSDGKVEMISQGHQRTYWGAKSVHAFQQIMKQLDKGEYFVRVRMLWNQPQKYNTAVLGAYAQQQIKFEKLSFEEGIQYAKQLMISFGDSKKFSQSGKVLYKILTMKGQFAFVGSTEQQTEYKIKFSFKNQQMKKCRLDWGKTSDDSLQMVVCKGKPGLVTAMRTDPANGGTTGSVSILGTPNQ